MRISDWSSDVCSSDLLHVIRLEDQTAPIAPVIVERQNHALEAQRLGHSGGRLLQCDRKRVPCRNAGAESSGRLDPCRRRPQAAGEPMEVAPLCSCSLSSRPPPSFCFPPPRAARRPRPPPPWPPPPPPAH